MNKSFKNIDDTIAAVSTPMGSGGIGIVRLSGPEALKIADCIFVSPQKTKPSEFASHTVHYGWLVDPEKKAELNRIGMVDEVLLTVMRAPKSYTKEDIVEISCHGGATPLQAVLDIMIQAGARLAEPGEFTKRAFLNGRIDLIQAEAVLDIIQSKTDAFLRVSTSQLKGELTAELENIREGMMSVYTQIEAIVNFPEDDISERSRDEILNDLSGALQKVDNLVRTGRQGKILKEGIKVVICGRPNVGKSSLLNVLLKQPRAIISPVPGTTRDTIEEHAQIKGIPFQLVDTAGILEPRDLIEEEAVKRSRMNIQGADLVLLILDSSEPLAREDKEILENIQFRNMLVVLNKRDLKEVISEKMISVLMPDVPIVKISALTKQGIDRLEDVIVNEVLDAHPENFHGVMISNLRHIESLKRCAQSLNQAKEIFIQKLAMEFASEEIKSAVSHLDRITGRDIDQDLLDQIFSQFCIGK